jgi:hypothetical protein
MIAPAAFGFDEIGPNIFAPPDLEPERRARMLADLNSARESVSAFFAVHDLAPIVVLCPGKSCDAAFGPSAPLGVAYGAVGFRLNTGGLNTVIAAHEYAHIAIKSRVGTLRMFLDVPYWFDEGLAVYLSKDTRFSDSVPQAVLLDLIENDSMRDWGRQVREYGWRDTYGGAKMLVENLAQEGGAEKLRMIVETLAAGGEFPRTGTATAIGQ